MSSGKSRNKVLEEREALGLLGTHRKGIQVAPEKKEGTQTVTEKPKIPLRKPAPKKRSGDEFPYF